jgi:hypothetical protein
VSPGARVNGILVIPDTPVCYMTEVTGSFAASTRNIRCLALRTITPARTMVIAALGLAKRGGSLIFVFRRRNLSGDRRVGKEIIGLTMY